VAWTRPLGAILAIGLLMLTTPAAAMQPWPDERLTKQGFTIDIVPVPGGRAAALVANRIEFSGPWTAEDVVIPIFVKVRSENPLVKWTVPITHMGSWAFVPDQRGDGLPEVLVIGPSKEFGNSIGVPNVATHADSGALRSVMLYDSGPIHSLYAASLRSHTTSTMLSSFSLTEDKTETFFVSSDGNGNAKVETRTVEQGPAYPPRFSDRDVTFQVISPEGENFAPRTIEGPDDVEFSGLVDITGDRVPDAILTNWGPSLRLGPETPPRLFAIDGATGAVVWEQPAPLTIGENDPRRSHRMLLFVGDVDNDGIVDMATYIQGPPNRAYLDFRRESSIVLVSGADGRVLRAEEAYAYQGLRLPGQPSTQGLAVLKSGRIPTHYALQLVSLAPDAPASGIVWKRDFRTFSVDDAILDDPRAQRFYSRDFDGDGFPDFLVPVDGLNEGLHLEVVDGRTGRPLWTRPSSRLVDNAALVNAWGRADVAEARRVNNSTTLELIDGATGLVAWSVEIKDPASADLPYYQPRVTKLRGLGDLDGGGRAEVAIQLTRRVGAPSTGVPVPTSDTAQQWFVVHGETGTLIFSEPRVSGDTGASSETYAFAPPAIASLTGASSTPATPIALLVGLALGLAAAVIHLIRRPSRRQA
jgi:outer membrane protein assembly factor BamB